MKKSLIGVLINIFSFALGGIIINKRAKKKKEIVSQMSDKHLSLFIMMNQWVKVKQDGKNLVEYFEKAGYKKIAIYGMSFAGETLVDELKNSTIHIVYGIDKNAELICSDINIITAEDEFDEVDVIVVTAITFFEEIKENLSNKVKCPIVSLEDILYEI